MLFRKNTTKCCEYCIYAEMKNSKQLSCSKKRVLKEDRVCFFYRYDPCKRIPLQSKAINFDQYSEEDFKL